MSERYRYIGDAPTQDDEHEVASYRHPMFESIAYRLVRCPEFIIITDALPFRPGEGPQIEIPYDCLVPVCEGFMRLLVPESEGGVPADRLGRTLEGGSEQFLLTRSMNCLGPDELGYRLVNLNRVNYYDDGRHQQIKLPDRFLFDTPLYATLVRLATEHAAAAALPPPDPRCAYIRPNWLGPVKS